MTEIKQGTRKGALNRRIQEQLRQELAGLPYFAPIPSERELCEKFGASRPTIRKAMAALEADKLVTRIQGRGSFYTGNKIEIDYADAQSHGIGLYRMLKSTGKETSSRVLQQVVEPVAPEVAAAMRLPEDAMVFHLKRLRYVNDTLYNLTDDYIPFDLCNELMGIDFTKNSLIQTLEEHNIIPCREDKTIEVVHAGKLEAAYLNLKPKAPVAVTRIVTYDKDDCIIQYATACTDAYKSCFHVISAVR